MKQILSIIIFAIFSIIACSAQEVSYNERLSEMFEVSGAEEIYVTVIKQMIDIQKRNAESTEVDWELLEKELLTKSIADLTEKLEPIYYKYLTIEDLEAIIEFYKSSAGRKLTLNNPKIVEESMLVGEAWGREIGEKMAKALEEN